MAELAVRDLQLGANTADDGEILAPVKLKCFTGPKGQRPAANKQTHKLVLRLPVQLATLAEATTREFISRTRYRIVADPNQADAVLNGTVTNFTSFPTVFDPSTGRASAVEVHVYMRVDLVERATGKTIFSRPNFEVRERYQISVDPSAFFEESDTALDRLSKQTARQVVSAILENF